MPGIYVEIDIHSSMEDLWARTQSPDLHQQWDLRFTEIQYLARPDLTQPQRFLYKTRIGFGLNIAGEGESVGTHENNGSRTSALKFWSDDSKSLIKVGSGYWQYIPLSDRIRFLTWYDYTTCFGLVGRFMDASVFRPLLGWATAWSFDRLRLWIEKGRDPAISLRQAAIYGICRTMVAFVWIYHGLVPKLLFEHHDESAMLLAGGIPAEQLTTALTVLGLAEIGLRGAMMIAWRARALFGATIVLMVVALLTVALQSPGYLVAAFNPVSLNMAMIALSVIGLLTGKDLPSAARCRRTRVETA